MEEPYLKSYIQSKGISIDRQFSFQNSGAKQALMHTPPAQPPAKPFSQLKPIVTALGEGSNLNRNSTPSKKLSTSSG